MGTVSVLPITVSSVLRHWSGTQSPSTYQWTENNQANWAKCKQLGNLSKDYTSVPYFCKFLIWKYIKIKLPNNCPLFIGAEEEGICFTLIATGCMVPPISKLPFLNIMTEVLLMQVPTGKWEWGWWILFKGVIF